jgi:hypothetical protein
VGLLLGAAVGDWGTFDEIITNGTANKGAPVIVTIVPADKAFKAEGCGTWQKA